MIKKKVQKRRMMKMLSKYKVWFTFKEVLDVYPAYAPVPNVTNETNWFLSMLSSAGLTLRYSGIKYNGTIIKEADVKKYIDAVTDVVFDRQHDNYIYNKEMEVVDYQLTSDDFKKAMNKFINIMNLTMPKYIPLLFQYEENYQDVLRKVTSESESFSRFNDTPQNEQDEVDYNTDDYASTMGRNKNISKVDSNSVPLKLKELQENFKSIILEWSNEFDMMFIDEYQLEG